MNTAVMTLLFLTLSLSVVLPASARNPILSSHPARITSPGTSAPSCLGLAAVCSSSKQCCSENCLLLVCALPVKHEKSASLKETTDGSLALESGTTAPSCLAILSVCSSSKQCCSENCLLLVCALPVEHEKFASLKETTDGSLALESGTTAPTCLAILSVCSSSKQCCSENCLLLVCALPVEHEKSASLKKTTDGSLALESGTTAPTCLAILSVCSSSKQCCSENCLLLVCALPVEHEKSASLKETTDGSLALESGTSAPSCLAILSVCSNSKQCCSENCLLLVCALPVGHEKSVSWKETTMGALAIDSMLELM